MFAGHCEFHLVSSRFFFVPLSFPVGLNSIERRGIGSLKFYVRTSTLDEDLVWDDSAVTLRHHLTMENYTIQQLVDIVKAI